MMCALKHKALIFMYTIATKSIKMHLSLSTFHSLVLNKKNLSGGSCVVYSGLNGFLCLNIDVHIVWCI